MVQHKFRLGTDRREAERRDELLRQLWERLEAEAGQQAALWDDYTLEIAKAVAKGIDRIPLPPLMEEESAISYAQRLQTTQDRFPFLKFQPTDEQRYAEGIGERAFQLKDIVLRGIRQIISNHTWKRKYSHLPCSRPVKRASWPMITSPCYSLQAPLLPRPVKTTRRYTRPWTAMRPGSGNIILILT